MWEPRAFLSTISQLRRTGRREDQLSDCFEACFNESVAFRTAVIDLVRKKCRMRVSSIPPGRWLCKAQHPVEGSRPDFVIWPHRGDGRPSADAVYFESKLDSRLSADQLRRHRRGGRTVIAITERHPELAAPWFKKQGVRCLRWSDVHEALPEGRRSAEGFVCAAFRDYLEEEGMAYRPVGRTDLTRLSHTFRTIKRPGAWSVQNLAFRAADDLLAALDELRREVTDRIEDEAGVELRPAGPGYYYWEGDESEPAAHYLCFGLKRADVSLARSRRKSLTVSFTFPDDGTEPYLEAYAFDHVTQSVVGTPCWRPPSRIMDSQGRLDLKKMVEFAMASAKKVGAPMGY